MRIAAGWRAGGKQIQHVVTEIVAPFGVGVGERPAVLTEGERVGWWERRREAKKERRRERREGVGVGRGGDGEGGRGEERV